MQQAEKACAGLSSDSPSEEKVDAARKLLAAWQQSGALQVLQGAMLNMDDQNSLCEACGLLRLLATLDISGSLISDYSLMSSITQALSGTPGSINDSRAAASAATTLIILIEGHDVCSSTFLSCGLSCIGGIMACLGRAGITNDERQLFLRALLCIGEAAEEDSEDDSSASSRFADQVADHAQILISQLTAAQSQPDADRICTSCNMLNMQCLCLVVHCEKVCSRLVQAGARAAFEGILSNAKLDPEWRMAAGCSLGWLSLSPQAVLNSPADKASIVQHMVTLLRGGYVSNDDAWREGVLALGMLCRARDMNAIVVNTGVTSMLLRWMETGIMAIRKEVAGMHAELAATGIS